LVDSDTGLLSESESHDYCRSRTSALRVMINAQNSVVVVVPKSRIGCYNCT